MKYIFKYNVKKLFRFMIFNQIKYKWQNHIYKLLKTFCGLSRRIDLVRLKHILCFSKMEGSIIPSRSNFLFGGRINLRYLKKFYFTWSRSRTCTNSEDGAIHNSDLRLKGVYYSIVTRYFAKFSANLRIFQWKIQKGEQPSNKDNLPPRKAMFLL